MNKLVLLFVIAFALIMLSSCDLRHDNKLPTGISPFDYLESAVISDTTNYMVHSTNDESYLFIRKNAISSGILKSGDYIWFSHDTSLAERDTIAIAGGMTPLTDALYFYVYRDSVMIPMQFNSGMISLYAVPKAAPANPKVLRFDELYITSEAAGSIAMDHDNAVFPVLKTGFFQYFDQGEVSSSVEFTGNGENFYAWHPDFSVFLPAHADWNGKHLKLTLQDALSSGQQTQLQHVFPSYAQTDKVIRYELTGSVSTSYYPQVRMWKQPSRFTPQMVIFQPGTAGQMLSLDNVDGLWQDQVTYKDVYLKYQGTYCFVNPLTDQDRITIPLDGSFSRIYFNRLYLDLRNTVVNNGSLNVDLSAFGRSLPDIYNGSIFKVTNPLLKLTFTFMQNGNELAVLPDSLWMEAGISLPAGTETAQQKWFGYHLDSSLEEEFYYTQGSSFDATHFSVANQYLFFPLAVSGLYFLGTDTNISHTYTIPVTRNAAYYQIGNMDINYSGAQTANLSHYFLDTQPSIDLTLPIFQGKPYQLTGTQAPFKAGFYQNGIWTETMPSTHVIGYRSSSKLRSNHVLIYDDADNWRKTVLLKSGSQVDDTHFIQTGSQYTIGGVMGGTYLLTSVNNIYATSVDFALSRHVYLDFDRLKLYHDSNTGDPAGYRLRVRIDQTFPDLRNILQSQYTLQQISWNYHVTALTQAGVADTTFLQQYTPTLFFASTQRTNPILVHLNQDKDYRIYTYSQGTTLTGFNFVTSGNFNSVVTAYNGDYCVFNDQNPHTAITTVNHATTSELITSLYQAQLFLPPYFIGTALPIGSKISLSTTTAAPVGINLVSGYKVMYLDNADNPLDLHLILNYLTDDYPYMYLPFPPELDPDNLHVRFVDTSGGIVEFTYVQDFSGTSPYEYIVVGNCVILPVDARGNYIISTN